MTDYVCLSAPSSAVLLLCVLVITTTMNLIWKSKDDDERNAHSRVRTPTLQTSRWCLHLQFCVSPCGLCSSVSIFTFPPVSPAPPSLLLWFLCLQVCPQCFYKAHLYFFMSALVPSLNKEQKKKQSTGGANKGRNDAETLHIFESVFFSARFHSCTLESWKCVTLFLKYHQGKKQLEMYQLGADWNPHSEHNLPRSRSGVHNRLL